ncbi:MAG: hypothetical protein KGL29_09520, partial [Alphaproteobacteria bacterium]|nr:hypothetical protein [Alphaproteobacteria bacterium]
MTRPNAKIRLVATIAALVAVPVLASGGADAAAKKAKKAAASPVAGATKIGDFGDWTAYKSKDSKSAVCYAVSAPKSRKPTGLTRDPAFVFVTQKPKEKVVDEVSFVLGFPALEKGAGDVATVKGAKFDLFGKGHTAWTKAVDDQPKLVAAMKAGADLVTEVKSAAGH